MPKRDDIRKVLLIGSGPIVIGQACEFDYSGSQACKALREEGYQVVLVNNNPATIMTDPDMADRTYIEPLTREIIEKIIARERPDVMLPTVGGQTGLNIAAELARNGTLERYGVELIGAKFEAIERAEKRELFREIMEKIGLEVAQSLLVHSVEEALAFAEKVGYPMVIRPSYTLGGTGGGIAYNVEELREMVENGLDYSPVKEVLVEESVIGWKEYELEVMRDRMDNVVIICSIENFDPMGIHTGDSITVAPAQTLSDKEYQNMRDAAINIIRAIGVETGGSNIQFAVHPETGRMLVVEMNPRVSRSSALASKATGFPIAKIAAKLAVGYTLDEIPNDITKKTPASFEPTIDYCVVKIPRWDFAKFPGADTTLTTQMKSVGEVMAIGRTFKEALQKAIRSLEQKRMGLGADGQDDLKLALASPQELERMKAKIREKLIVPRPDRLFYLRHGFQAGMSIDEVYGYTKIDKWFLYNLKQIVDLEAELAKQLQSVGGDVSRIDPRLLLKAKSWGFSDYQIAFLAGVPEAEVREKRIRQGVEAVYKLVDTCAAEFEAHTPYYYSTYEAEDEVRKSDRPKVMILGGGPNRIGQGIEFDYCCVQAAFASKEENREVIMVNCNPETVSTDYDTSDKLYFEPLTLEDVLNIYDKEMPEGVILQFGGQTPLKLALSLEEAGVPILGTSPRSIDLAEDREKFAEIVRRLGLLQPPNGTGRSVAEAKAVAQQIGYPVLVRPSYVLGGRAMEIIYDEGELEDYMTRAVAVSPEYPVLIDKFIEDATEIDVDAISDGSATIVAGVMEHIEQAGVHSGDSSCSLPPYSLAPAQIEELKENTRLLAQALNVVGLINIQYAIKNGQTYILEVNPRASRTVPFVSKATGIPWAKVATKVMLGQTLAQLGIQEELVPKHTAVKEAVFPFVKFPGVDIILGPEMRSTGEVMGIDENFGAAFAKSQVVAETPLPLAGTALITVADKDKAAALHLAQELVQLGFTIWATPGTAKFLRENGLQVTKVNKLAEGRPHILDHIKNGHVDLLINTPVGKGPKYDEYKMRRLATMHRVPIITTIQGARAAVEGIKAQKREGFQVKSIQEYHASVGLS